MELIKSAGKINKLACSVQSTSGVNFLMTNGNLALEVLVDVSGVEVMLPGMRENTRLAQCYSLRLPSTFLTLISRALRSPRKLERSAASTSTCARKRGGVSMARAAARCGAFRGLVWDLANAN